MRRVWLPALACSAALVALPAASASAAPGSAIDEYQEHVPGGAGERPSDEVGGGGAGSLPPGTSSALEDLGPAGAAAAELAKGTAPKRGNRSDDLERASDSGSGLGEVLDRIVGGSGDADEGMGPVLPLILGLSLLAAIAFAIARRRGHADEA